MLREAWIMQQKEHGSNRQKEERIYEREMVVHIHDIHIILLIPFSCRLSINPLHRPECFIFLFSESIPSHELKLRRSCHL